MSALTEARDTREIAAGGVRYTREFTVATGSTVYAGAITAVNSSGKAIPATSSGAITVVGRAENTAAAGETVKTRSGMFLYNPVSSGAISVTDVNKKCYVADDQTVTLTSGTSAVVAGVVRDVTAGGVVTEIGNGPL
jgi:hypothetical protein